MVKTMLFGYTKSQKATCHMAPSSGTCARSGNSKVKTCIISVEQPAGDSWGMDLYPQKKSDKFHEVGIYEWNKDMVLVDFT